MRVGVAPRTLGNHAHGTTQPVQRCGTPNDPTTVKGAVQTGNNRYRLVLPQVQVDTGVT